MSFDKSKNAQGLLRHGTNNAPARRGLEQYTLFGDYYLLEMLAGFQNASVDFWGKPTKGA